MYTKFMELKLTRTIHHVESERNYSTTFSLTYPDTEFFSTIVPSCLVVIWQPFLNRSMLIQDSPGLWSL